MRKQVSYRFESCEVKYSDLLAEKTVTNFILSASELIVVVVLSEVQWQVLFVWNGCVGKFKVLE